MTKADKTGELNKLNIKRGDLYRKLADVESEIKYCKRLKNKLENELKKVRDEIEILDGSCLFSDDVMESMKSYD